MFTEIDKILYPNKCEVIQVTSHNFIYPIFKNGSSSLYDTANDNNWKILLNNQIEKCEKITVFIREPLDRLYTGINSYIEELINIGLDENTILYFINNYAFLNRHYLPQILWLTHLVRYAKSNVILSVKHIDDIKYVANHFTNRSKSKNYTFINKLDIISKLNFYISADEFLLKYINQEVTWSEIISRYKLENSAGYDHIFAHAEKLSDALPKI